MLFHSLLACSRDGTLLLSHYWVETSLEQQATWEAIVAAKTVGFWAASHAVAVPLRLCEGIVTMVSSADDVVYVVSCMDSDCTDDVELFDEGKFFQKLITEACDGKPASKLGDPAFLAKVMVALEECVACGAVIVRNVENILRLAKLKGPETA
jgi:hypothetical protein